MGAEKDLNDKIELLGSLIVTRHIRFKDGDPTRILVDLYNALKTVRKYSKIIKAETGVDPLSHIHAYLSNPND